MNKSRTLPALLVCALMLGGCSDILDRPIAGQDAVRLSACTGTDSVFEPLPFDEWPEKYHSTVSEVIKAHQDSLRDTNTEQLECTAPDYPSVVKPTAALKNLARTLAPWNDAKKLDALSEMDIGPVLLEYVRVYECTLAERRNYLTIIIPKDIVKNTPVGPDPLKISREDFNVTLDTETRIINHEIAVARTALNRTLVIVGGEDRLRPLSLDIECLKRVSLDIRNILGLVSQAVACMPRARDARGSLRDLPPLPE